METSPAEVKLVGMLLVTAVSETENRLEPLSRILNRFAAVPLLPMLILKRSLVVVVDDPGCQSRVYPAKVVEVETLYW